MPRFKMSVAAPSIHDVFLLVDVCTREQIRSEASKVCKDWKLQLSFNPLQLLLYHNAPMYAPLLLHHLDQCSPDEAMDAMPSCPHNLYNQHEGRLPLHIALLSNNIVTHPCGNNIVERLVDLYPMACTEWTETSDDHMWNEERSSTMLPLHIAAQNPNISPGVISMLANANLAAVETPMQTDIFNYDDEQVLYWRETALPFVCALKAGASLEVLNALHSLHPIKRWQTLDILQIVDTSCLRWVDCALLTLDNRQGVDVHSDVHSEHLHWAIHNGTSDRIVCRFLELLPWLCCETVASTMSSQMLLHLVLGPHHADGRCVSKTVLEALLAANEHALRCRDHNGNIPIHIVARHRAKYTPSQTEWHTLTTALHVMCNRWPPSAIVKDQTGRLLRDLLQLKQEAGDVLRATRREAQLSKDNAIVAKTAHEVIQKTIVVQRAETYRLLAILKRAISKPSEAEWKQIIRNDLPKDLHMEFDVVYETTLGLKWSNFQNLLYKNVKICLLTQSIVKERSNAQREFISFSIATLEQLLAVPPQHHKTRRDQRSHLEALMHTYATSNANAIDLLLRNLVLQTDAWAKDCEARHIREEVHECGIVFKQSDTMETMCAICHGCDDDDVVCGVLSGGRHFQQHPACLVHFFCNECMPRICAEPCPLCRMCCKHP